MHPRGTSGRTPPTPESPLLAPLPILLAGLLGCGSCSDGGFSVDTGGVFFDDTGFSSCSGIGFAAEASEWTLPTGYDPGAFAAPEAPRDCAAGVPGHALLDVSGDGVADLIVTSACDDTTVGTSLWRVYYGTGTGFTVRPIEWALPPGYGDDAFPDLSGAADCSAGRPGYAFRDMDGDGHADLVVTAACDDDTVGGSHWRVYAGSDDGFSADPTIWALPDGYPSGAFRALSGAADCDAGTPTYFVADLYGSGTDLVVSHQCDDPALGTQAWKVYTGRGDDGYTGAPTAWDLPEGYADGAFPADEGALDCDTGRPAYTLAAMVVGGTPDLVVTQECDDALVGNDLWRVYRRQSSDFADPEPYRLPDDYGTDAFPTLTSDGSCDDGIPAYRLASLHGATYGVDLVVTARCDDSALGTSEFLVYAHADDGDAFGDETWELPEGYGAGAFAGSGAAATCPDGEVAWTLADVTGDGLDDLVVTGVCDDADVGTATWRVYPVGCIPG